MLANNVASLCAVDCTQSSDCTCDTEVLRRCAGQSVGEIWGKFYSIAMLRLSCKNCLHIRLKPKWFQSHSQDTHLEIRHLSQVHETCITETLPLPTLLDALRLPELLCTKSKEVRKVAPPFQTSSGRRSDHSHMCHYKQWP